jgi:uncharacterized protein YqjF (DUF2071 family)
MTGSRPARAPGWLALAPIPELNVRTYVRVRGVPGVWFLSLDAASQFFAHAGRAVFGLRYHVADMTAADDGASVHYLSRRGDVVFAAQYEPSGAPEPAEPGSLEHSLFERYRLYAERRRQLVTATVAHEPWPLQAARARIGVNRMAPPRISFDEAPLVHFCRGLEARISLPTSISESKQRGDALDRAELAAFAR